MTITTIRNLTPHAVTVFADGRPVHIVQPDGVVARAAEVGGEPSGYLMLAGDPAIAVPLRAPVRFAATVDLPAPAEGVALIVSLVTADAARAEGRDCSDLFTVADIVRDATGRIVGCLALRRVA